MNNYNFNYGTTTSYNESSVRSFMNNVFAFMAAGLALTGVLAYWFGNNLELMSYLVDMEIGKMTGLGWAVMFAPLAFILVMSFGINRISFPVLVVLFGAYASVMGVSLSFIFLTYTATSIYKTFAISSAMFGFMAILGYTTKQDLSGFGKILMMALFGIIIASLINWFMKSEMMDYIISVIGVLVFTGLTAYDVQKLKRIGSGELYGNADRGKLAIMGALDLYLDFVNLFLYLLRLFGDRRD